MPLYNPPAAGGGSLATDTLWAAKGDLAAASGNDAASVLAVGSNAQVLTADSAQALGIKWAAAPGGGVIADTIWDAKGDLAVGTAADTAARLAVGANNLALVADSAQSTGLKWNVPILSSVSNYISGDVTMTTAGTYYDGGSVSCVAGTWLLVGQVWVLASTTATRTFSVRLWDGSAVTSTAFHTTTGTGTADQVSLFIAGIVTPGSTTTYKVSVTSTVNADTIKHNTSTGTYLLGIRIA